MGTHSRLLIAWTFCAVLGTVGAPALAQFRRGPDRGGGDRGDWQRRMLDRMDSNGNGVLEPNEVSSRARPFIERIARDAGLDPDRPIPLDRLTKSSSSRPGREDRGRRDRADRRDNRNQDQRASEQDSYPLIPGFDATELPVFGADPRSLDGRLIDLEKRYDSRVLERVARLMGRYDKDGNGILDHTEWAGVSWRGNPRESDLDHDGQLTRAEMAERIAKETAQRERDGSPSSAGPRPSPADGRRGEPRPGRDRRDTNSADNGADRRGRGRGSFDPTAMLRRFDRNENGIIEPDELDERTRRFAGRFLERMGVDPDAPIRIDELSRRLQQRAKERAGRDSNSKENDRNKRPERVSYRVEGAQRFKNRRSFRAVGRVLPDDLPAWWDRKDKNGDGQVTLDEFLTTRSRESLSAFAKYDLNDDGIVTAHEAEIIETDN